MSIPDKKDGVMKRFLVKALVGGIVFGGMVASFIGRPSGSARAAGPGAQQGSRSASKSPASLYVATFVDLMPQNIKPGTEAIKDYVAGTRKEPGVVRIEAIAQAGGRENHLIIFEVWKDQKAFDQHEASRNTRDYRARLVPLMGAPFDQRLHFLVQ
jgi:quinol monooxygenase YgiN